MKLTPTTPQRKISNSANSPKATKPSAGPPENSLFDHKTENKYWQKVTQDGELRKQHVAILLSTPGFENLTQQEAQDQVDTMLRYITLLYELVMAEE